MQSNFYEIVYEVDKYLANPIQNSLNEILKLFPQTGIKRYFWRELITNDKLNHAKWFNILVDNNLFSLKTSKETEIIHSKQYINYWQEIEYLEKICNNYLNKQNAKILNDIVNNLIEEYYDLIKEGYELHEHIYWITFKIFAHNKVEYLNIKHLEFIEFILERNDKTLISADLKSEFHDKVFETKNVEFITRYFELLFSFTYKDDEFTSLVELYWLEELTKEIASIIPVEYQQLVLKIVLDKIENIINIKKFSFDSFLIPSIEPSTQERYSSSKVSKVLIDFTRDLLESMDAQLISMNIKKMLTEGYDIHKRLAIHIINYKYEELKNIFWSIDYNPIDNSELNHELFMLFKNHVNEFSIKESERIIEWNETQDLEYLKEYDNYKNLINKDKRKILYAFKNAHEDNILKKDFEKYNNALDFDEEHPEFNSYFSGFTERGSKSPYSIEEISNMEISELVKEIKSFKEKESTSFNNPTISGFASEIKLDIEENYVKYIDNLDFLVNIPSNYHYYILSGLNSKIYSYTKEELNLYIEYIKKVISLKEVDNKYNELVAVFEDFIRKISSTEKVVKLDKEQVNVIITIFKDLRNKIQYYSSGNEKKSDILNSNEGQFYTSIIVFSLKVARDKLHDTNAVIWHNELKQIILEDLEIKKSFHLFEVMGRYLPNIYYLDKEWIENKLEDLFIKSSDIYRSSLYKGYLSNPTVYLDIYTDIKDIGAFEFMLNMDFEIDNLNKKVIELICIAFITDHDNDLIYDIVKDGKTEQKKLIIDFFKSNRNESVDIEKHLIPLWKEFLNSLDKKETDLYIGLFSWMNKLKTINNDTYKLILETIEKIDSFPKQYTYEIARKIFDFIPENTKKIAIILIELLKKFDISFYQTAKLIESIEKIYKEGLIEEGNEISNLIGQNGNYALKEVYIKYN
ncbi:hypothetical protein CRV02_13060 [Arcobacter sp. CECT 8989]|uniref:hypothetical protein n=1 Tax=Arcobacter sp. CECT 8989 TaxID=2044509 RepID=UPI00100A8F35|nr:hypothetical protein [Arcobacter sp. CECT 8989]RXJ98674.1 hypothetical protein CRV02_13060 [Arcobacter sp. CECT 8989]